MIGRFENLISGIVRTRGGKAVLDLAAAVAIWPYIAIGWPGVSSPYLVAAALMGSLVMLAALRVAIPSLVGADHLFSSAAATAASSNDPAIEGHSRQAAPELHRARDRLVELVETHDVAAGRAVLGLIQFANYPAMAAFDADAAERVMKQFARRLEGAVGQARPMAQISENCFAIWFSNRETGAPFETELKVIADVLAQEIEDQDIAVSPDIYLSSAAPARGGTTAVTLFAQAHAALTPLKRFGEEGKGPKHSSRSETPAARFAMEQALRRAVRQGELSLRYQPFVDVARGAVAGAEVLLRWRHPTLGDISPTRFVPLLEETGLIHDIGLWTLNSACKQLQIWRSAGSDLRLAINLSAVQLQNQSLKTGIERTVASHGLSPADVELELTETAAMEDEKRTVELFQELRANGFGIAIDDFGNGHSNLGYLKNLPFTKLKIDREFVAGVDTEPGCQAICKAVIELGAGLGITVLAEGVERFEQVAALRRLGCHIFQGFYFAGPLLAEELTDKLADPEWSALIGSDVHRSRAELQKRIAS